MAGRNAGQADVILEGAADDEAFASVAGAGDLNKDGFSDVVVGASAYKTPGGTEICNNFIDDNSNLRIDRQDPDCHLGRAYVFLGGASLPQRISAADGSVKRIERPAGGDGFAFSVASAGDVNDDGFADLLVGAFLSDIQVGSTTVEDAGRAYLYFGGSTFDPNPDVTFLGEAAFVSDTPLSGQFGFAVSGAGKLNNDNLEDIIIGGYLHDTGILATQSDVGRVYIFFGRSSFSATIQAGDACQTTSEQCITGSVAAPGPDNGFGVSVQ